MAKAHSKSPLVVVPTTAAEHETHIEYTAERLATVRAAKRVPAEAAPQLGPPNFNFRRVFGIAWIYNERGKVIGFTTTPEGVRQMTNFLLWKETLPAHEVAAGRYAEMLVDCINQEKGTFLRDELGGYHIVLDGQSRIPIDPEAPELKRFLLDVCDITTCSPDAAMTIERLKVHADRTASKMMFRRFSAMYEDETSRVYLPIANAGKLLLITPKEIALVPNGNNYDQVWLEHPEQNPFKYQPDGIDAIRAALRTFEELIVDSQACAVPAMRWFVGMAEGLFPVVRDAISNRFIMVHKGKKGHGKTTGAKSPVLLHGFEDVFMDASVAALGNIPEQGLVVIDNKEAKNFTQPLIDYFLSVATGGKRLRSTDGGVGVRRNAPRPVAVITSIEGVHKAELHDRCIDVKYFLDADQERIKRGALEKAILAARDRMMSALVVVIQEYLTTRVDPVARQITAFVNPIDRFSEHFEEVCYLLIAYGRVVYGEQAGDAWAAKIIYEWDVAIGETRGDDATDVPVSALEAPVLGAALDGHIPVPFTWQGTAGKLYVVFPGDILTALQRNLALRDLPTEPGQLVERLNSEHFERFVFLTARSVDESDEPLGKPKTGILRRRENGQPVGVWVSNGAGAM